MHPRSLSLLLVAALPGCRAPAPPPADPLVQASELRSRAAETIRVIVDLRPAPDFAAGHIPGAVRLDIEQLRAEVDGVREQLAPRETVANVLATIGLDPDDEVIVVDDKTSPRAARLVWTLAYYGHDPAKVRVLDGGWPAWLAAAGPTSAEITTTPASAPHLGAEQPTLRVDAAWMLAHLEDPDVLRLDVRTDEEWKAGRIPGAQHIPWQQAQTADGRMREPAPLRDLYARALASPTVAVYCKSGMRASFTWLVLRTLGHRDVRVYDGSWIEWGARPDLPKEV